MKDAARNTDEIRTLLEECVAEANEQAAAEHQVDFADYDFTGADLEYVTDELGRKPTREEWDKAGLEWVGGAHCA